MSRLLKVISTVARSEPQESPEAARYALASLKPLIRSWISTVPELRRRDVAAIFARHAFLKFASVQAPAATLREPFHPPFGRVDAAILGMAESFGAHAAALSLAEGAHAISGLYTTLLASRERSALGAYYTPASLTQRLCELAEEGGVDWKKARVLDPASGGGAFLLPLAARMRDALAGSDPAVILAQIGARLTGLELDPHAAWFGQAALELQLSDLAQASGKPVPLIVRVVDTLEEAPRAQFDLVIGNPPYGRVSLTPAQRQRYARGLYGHANLYGVFTDIAVRWAKPGGLIAYLTPTSVLGGQYFAALRELLARHAPPEAIDFVCSRRGVFEDALQETLLALYRKGGAAKPVQVHYLKVSSENDAVLQKNGTVTLPADPKEPWLAPRSPEQSKLAAAASLMPTRLADWGYRVSTGPLVWNRFKDQLVDRPARNCYPLIWAEAVTADGRFVFRADKKNHSPFFKAKPGDDWLIVREPSVLVQRTTAKEQPRRLIAAELPKAFMDLHGAVVVENHLNMVRPVGTPKVSAPTLAAVLNSVIVDQVFRCISGSVAVSAFELEAVPLPSVAAMQKIEALVKRGASRSTIDKALTSLYSVERSE